MKYYSEVLRKTYDSEDECIKAEKDYNDKVAAEKVKQEKLTTERKARAKEVEDAYTAIVEAQKHYKELRNAFIKDYGSWHMTFSTKDDLVDDFDDFWNSFFRVF